MSAGTFHIHHIDNASHDPKKRWNIELEDPLRAVATRVLDATSAADVMRLAQLDWRVEEHALFTADKVPVPSHKALTRSDNQAILGVVGKGFVPYQNADAFAFVDGLVTDGYMKFLSAGQISGGKKVFIQSVICSDDENATEIVPGDAVLPYFVLANGHDGGLAIRAVMTPQRIVCQNTFRIAVTHQKKTEGIDSFTFKHTTNVQERLEKCKDLFGWVRQGFNEFVEGARETAKRPISTEAKVREFFREVYAIEDVDALSDRSQSLAKERENRLVELFDAGAGQKNVHVHGTAWAAINAVTQYLDHEGRTALRGIDVSAVGPDEKLRLQEAKRFESNLIGNGSKIKQRAFELALTA